MSAIRHTDTVEVILKDRRQRRWAPAEKTAQVRRTYEPGMSVSLVARQQGVTASLLFQRQKLELQGALMVVCAEKAVVSASKLAVAHAGIAKLQRVPGKKTLENEILKETVEHAAEKVDGVLALVALGRTTKMVFWALCVARSLLVSCPANNLHMKPRLHTHGCVANPRDSKGYRCGLRLALGVNPSVSFHATICGTEH